MSEGQKNAPRVTADTAAGAAKRQDRLAQALRANLQRRKAQSRRRSAEPPAIPRKG
jgi:hypothetical protein